MTVATLVSRISDAASDALKYQNDQVEAHLLQSTKPFQELSCILSEAKSNDEFLEELSFNPKLLSRFGFGQSKAVNILFIRNLISYQLDRIVNTYKCVERFSSWDHYLFSTHIQLEDTHHWFAKTFHDINSHTHNFASKILKVDPVEVNSRSSTGPVVFVFKGQTGLAHYVNFKNYLISVCKIVSPDNFRVIFLDLPSNHVSDLPCKVFYLGRFSTLDRLTYYSQLLRNLDAKSVIWIACAQNLGLFMFSRLCPHQAYWSMKYHSIFSLNIDRYYRSSTICDQKSFEEISWFGIPSELRNLLPFIHTSKSSYAELLGKFYNSNQPISTLTLGREVKIDNPLFHKFVSDLVNANISFSYSGRNKVEFISDLSNLASYRIQYLGWLSLQQMQKVLTSCLIYLDSFPFGGGHTCFYALSARKPVLMIDTEQNRRCSFLMHLYDLLSIYGKNINCPDTLRSYGVFNEVNEIVDFLNSVGARDKSSFLGLQKIQKNQEILFGRFFREYPFQHELSKSVQSY